MADFEIKDKPEKTELENGDAIIFQRGTSLFHILRENMMGVPNAFSAEGIIAYAGGGQTNATQLVTVEGAHFRSRIDTVATTADSVKPDAAAVKDMEVTVVNRGANAMNVYPFLGDRFLDVDGNLMAIDAPFSLEAGNSLHWYCFEAGVMTIL